MDAGTGGLSARCRLRAELLGRCQGAEVLQVREMESHEEFWADWLRQDNEYAIGDRKAMEAGGLNFIAMVLRKSKDGKAPEGEWLLGPCRLGEDRVEVR